MTADESTSLFQWIIAGLVTIIGAIVGYMAKQIGAKSTTRELDVLRTEMTQTIKMLREEKEAQHEDMYARMEEHRAAAIRQFGELREDLLRHRSEIREDLNRLSDKVERLPEAIRDYFRKNA